MRQGAGGLVSERRKSLPRPVRAFRRSPSEPLRPSIAPLGLPQKGGSDSGVQVRRYAHDWNLAETLAEMAECKNFGRYWRARLRHLNPAPCLGFRAQTTEATTGLKRH